MIRDTHFENIMTTIHKLTDPRGGAHNENYNNAGKRKSL